MDHEDINKLIEEFRRSQQFTEHMVAFTESLRAREAKPRIADLNSFHITISAPGETHADLSNQVKMAKAALMYADKATLCSATTVMSLSVHKLKHLSTSEKISFLEDIGPIIGSDVSSIGLLQEFLSGKKGKNPQIFAEIIAAPILNILWSKVANISNNTVPDKDIKQLLEAQKLGLLDIHLFDNSFGVEAMIREQFEVATNSLSNPNTYPLLDERTSQLIAASIREGIVTVSDAASFRGKHIALAASLLERLPTFDTASFRDIIEIREVLVKPRAMFRSAVLRFTSSVSTAAWDLDFEIEANRVFMQEVEPAILEIEEEVKANRFLAKLSKATISQPADTMLKSALGLGLAHGNYLPHAIAHYAGAILVGGAIVQPAIQEWLTQKRSIEGNEMYFYYRASKF